MISRVFCIDKSVFFCYILSLEEVEVKILFVPAELINPKNVLSDNTLCRCRAALKLWQSGDFDLLLLTGGLFLEPERQTRPASEIMRDWFVENGVSQDWIRTERQSLDTYQNVSLSLQELQDVHIESITVVTQYQHALRFLATFFLAHGQRIRVNMIRQPAMSWKDWFMEWLVLVPYHLIDWRGTLWLATWNRQQRRRAAQLA